MGELLVVLEVQRVADLKELKVQRVADLRELL